MLPGKKKKKYRPEGNIGCLTSPAPKGSTASKTGGILWWKSEIIHQLTKLFATSMIWGLMVQNVTFLKSMEMLSFKPKGNRDFLACSNKAEYLNRGKF